MLTLMLILMVNIILATWLVLVLLSLGAGRLSKALNGAVLHLRLYQRSCASCTVRHFVMSSGSEILARLRLALLLGFLIASFSCLFLLLQLKSTRSWGELFSESCPTRLSPTPKNTILLSA